MKTNPIIFKNLALSTSEFMLIFLATVHNEKVVAESLYFQNREYKRQSGIEYSLEQLDKRSIDLALFLLRKGIYIEFLKESDIEEIKKISPPLYDKYYNKNLIEK
ncbi:hypothetical protein J2X97_000349 [Epilithonimonas hungarica]|uniref:hypothetical protein n=1 Tax=Epilithonimonas hungarica TaxID=454006 RepID=UPI002782C3A3|nr:hypothetical protein [Epilithonimonas hungarica]MDP9954712.1 hypothetical protein [Epilithonimonas hungarica]